jgi:hypothetical protein
MTIRIAAAFLLFGALALSPGFAAADDPSSSLEQALIESATTPAAHAALAKHYRAKAAEAQAEARSHESMAKSYVPASPAGKTTWGTIKQRQKMSEHCKKLSQRNTEMAQEYESLAKLHDEQAK